MQMLFSIQQVALLLQMVRQAPEEVLNFIAENFNGKFNSLLSLEKLQSMNLAVHRDESAIRKEKQGSNWNSAP